MIEWRVELLRATPIGSGVILVVVLWVLSAVWSRKI